MNLRNTLFLCLLFCYAFTKQKNTKTNREKSARKLDTANATTTPANSTRVTNGTALSSNISVSSTPAPGICYPTLMKAFGFSGIASPIAQLFTTCPTIINSCCTLSDEQVIIQNLIKNQEYAEIKANITNYGLSLYKFLQAAKNVTSTANDYLERWADLPNNECKLMARRLLTYQIEDLEVPLRTMFTRHYDFFETSYKGFYCSLCDADNGRNIDLAKTTFFLSQRFCRNLLISSLPSVTYLKVHLPIYTKLISTFIGGCSIDGPFQQVQYPDGLAIENDGAASFTIQKCFELRNGKRWAENCLPICKEFSFGKFSNMFIPNQKSFQITTDFLIRSIPKFYGIPVSNTTNSTNGTNGTNATSNTSTPTNATTPAADTTVPESRRLNDWRRKLKKGRNLSEKKHKQMSKKVHFKNLKSKKEKRNLRVHKKTIQLKRSSPQKMRVKNRRLDGTTNSTDSSTSTNTTNGSANASNSSNGTASALLVRGPGIFFSVQPSSGIDLTKWIVEIKMGGIDPFRSGLAATLPSGASPPVKIRKLNQKKAKKVKRNRAKKNRRKKNLKQKHARKLKSSVISQFLLSVMAILVCVF